MEPFGRIQDRRRQKQAQFGLAALTLAAAGYVGGSWLSQPRPVVIEPLASASQPAAASHSQAQGLLSDPAAKPAPVQIRAKAPPAAAISINSSDQAALETLPGIGPALAGRILQLRTQRGGFQRIEELMDVKGIGPKTFAKMAPFLRL
jgi:competence protein ComEA